MNTGYQNISERNFNNSNLKKRKRSWDKMWAVFSVLPSLAAILIFVYGFIAWTGYVSFSKWNTFLPNYAWAGVTNYLALFKDFRFQSDIRNLVFFTLFFIFICLTVGLFLATLLDRKIKAESFFRNIFLFPMSLSFIVTGVVWMWLLNPDTGVNLILKSFGLHHLPNWFISTRIIPSDLKLGLINIGFPVALLSIVIASVWQMSGFAMALYLAGLRAIPEEMKEAASVDGAGLWKTFWHITLPQLNAVTVSVVIILIQISMKTFDLVYTMTGPGKGFITDMPSLYMFSTTFQANQYAKGSAIAIVMFIMMSLVTIPYLYKNMRSEERHR
jgi:glucose/mannose transport system permease protein